MKTLLCAFVLVAFMAAVAGAATPEDLKAAQTTADEMFKAIADKDFDKYKEKVSAKRAAEYAANAENCPIKRWYDTAREEIDKHGAKWEFIKVKANYPAQVELDYKRTLDTGETTCTIYLVKEGDKWLVDAAGSI
jgi:hypothetical protein